MSIMEMAMAMEVEVETAMEVGRKMRKATLRPVDFSPVHLDQVWWNEGVMVLEDVSR